MKVEINGIYRHFKGNTYRVIAIAKHSETMEDMVVYQALYGDYVTYVRPYESFVSKVDKIKYPEISQEYRFELIPVPGVLPQDNENEKTGDIKEDIKIDSDSQSDKTEEMTDLSKSEEVLLRPLVEEFLDADTLEDRHNILVRLHDTVTHDEITIMSTVLDVEVDEDLDLENRYRQLMKCIDTMHQFETNRLR